MYAYIGDFRRYIDKLFNFRLYVGLMYAYIVDLRHVRRYFDTLRGFKTISWLTFK